MARLSNVNEGLTHAAVRRSKSHTTYGRHNRNKHLSHVYHLPLSPPTKLQPRRDWTSINKDRSARQIEDGLTPPNSTQKFLAKSSPASSPAPKPLGESTKRGLGPRPIANESIAQSTHVPALQPRAAPNRSPVQSRSKLHPKTTTSESNTGKSAAVETPNQAEFPPSDIISKGVGNVPVSDDHTQARTAIHNSKLGLSVDTEMEEANGDGDPDKEKQSPTHTGDGDEYFEVEAIKSCKLSSKGLVLLRVKWRDYEFPSEITWEPEKVLRSDIPQVLDVYFEERGGRDKVVNDLQEKRAREKAYARKKGVARVKG